MAAIKLQQFAEQIGITSSKLVQQLAAAGITEKGADALLSDQEKEQLLSYLRGGGEAEQGEFLKLLNATSAKIVSLDKVKPTSITFDGRKSELRLDVLAPDYQTLNNFKSSLTDAGLLVDMSSASSQGDAYSTRLIIRSGS